jgi:hypothetical protein
MPLHNFIFYWWVLLDFIVPLESFRNSNLNWIQIILQFIKEFDIGKAFLYITSLGLLSYFTQFWHSVLFFSFLPREPTLASQPTFLFFSSARPTPVGLNGPFLAQLMGCGPLPSVLHTATAPSWTSCPRRCHRTPPCPMSRQRPPPLEVWIHVES